MKQQSKDTNVPQSHSWHDIKLPPVVSRLLLCCWPMLDWWYNRILARAGARFNVIVPRFVVPFPVHWSIPDLSLSVMINFVLSVRTWTSVGIVNLRYVHAWQRYQHQRSYFPHGWVKWVTQEKSWLNTILRRYHFSYLPTTEERCCRWRGNWEDRWTCTCAVALLIALMSKRVHRAIRMAPIKSLCRLNFDFYLFIAYAPTRVNCPGSCVHTRRPFQPRIFFLYQTYPIAGALKPIPVPLCKSLNTTLLNPHLYH